MPIKYSYSSLCSIFVSSLCVYPIHYNSQELIQFIFSELDPCNDTEVIRLSPLTSNNNRTLGRLEVCYDGYWGSVCDHFPDRVTADVVCRQLGHERGQI